jgi:hypothetical protein
MLNSDGNPFPTSLKLGCPFTTAVFEKEAEPPVALNAFAAYL